MKDRYKLSGKAASLLHRLRITRQAKGLSLEEIASNSKISMIFLRAIESGDFHVLPGGIYNLCYLRQYAALTGFPETELIDFYNSWLPAEQTAVPAAGLRVRMNGFLAGVGKALPRILCPKS